MLKGKILIIDDDVLSMEVAANLLIKEGYEVLKVTSGLKGLLLAIQNRPDVVLLDIVMPTIDGFKTAQKFKEHTTLKDIPIIFLTNGHVEDFIEKAYAVGAVDYIMKPVTPRELLARVDTQIQIKTKQEYLKKSYKTVKKKNKQLNQLVITDDLTKLFTRKFLIEHIEKEKRDFTKTSKVFSLIMIDIDYFKNINDQYGHSCGDHILIRVSKKLKNSLREKDIIARWGGEEFLILLPQTELEEGKIVAKRMLNDIRKTKYCYEDIELSVSISCGMTEYKIDQSIDKIIKETDKKLYEAKRKGRNQISY